MSRAAAGALVLLAAVAASAETVLIRGGTILTVTHGNVENGSILIRDGKIAEIGTNVSAPADATVIDAAGQWILPGIIDAHSHIAAESINEGSV
ncbi:MAG: amidohydrolase family protein, partial [Vicinamibacteria bacterium]